MRLPAAQESGPKAHPFLITKRHQFDGPLEQRGGSTPLQEALHSSDRGDDAKSAVILAGVNDRVLPKQIEILTFSI